MYWTALLMSLRDEILRHQLLLMRLINTQSNRTKKLLKEAEKRIIKAINDDSYASLRTDVKAILDGMSNESKPLLKELAKYEADYTTKKIKKYNGKAKPLSSKAVNDVYSNTKISVSLNRAPKPVETTYQLFADAKLKQYIQTIRDSKVLKEDKDTLITKIQEQTRGLFFTQNQVLAASGVIGIANGVRLAVADKNSMLVEWVLDLELNNCEYCIEQADNSPYNPEDIDGLIPAHGRCGCTAVPI